VRRGRRSERMPAVWQAASRPKRASEGDLMEVRIPKSDQRQDIGRAQFQKQKAQEVAQLNAFITKKWKSQRKKSKAPTMNFIGRPNNPYRDRYLLCKDCERRIEYEDKEPCATCNSSTLLEIDMTVPWSRDNVLVMSCQVVQMIMEDVWVKKDPDMGFVPVHDKDDPDAFPVQVCAGCRATTLQKGRRFRICEICEGVSYCSDACYAKHRLRHKASCTLPHLPYREEWGVRRKLRAMRSEIYPLAKTWAIREPHEHRIAWLPPPRPKQIEGKGIRLQLPGFRSKNPLLPAAPVREVHVSEGKIALVEQPRRMRLQRPNARRRRAASEPDPEQLLCLGMTREEYLNRIGELQEEALNEDVRLLNISVAEEEAMAQEELTIELFKGGQAGEGQEPPPQWSRDLVLDDEALSRVEAAAGEAPAEPPPRRLAPWEELEEEDVSRAGGRGSRRLAPKDLPPEEERKEGVVYRGSLVKEVVQKHGLRLSPEALERLEEAAASGKSSEKNKAWTEPPKDNEMGI